MVEEIQGLIPEVQRQVSCKVLQKVFVSLWKVPAIEMFYIVEVST